MSGMRFTKLAHCIYKCDYHIVIVTKYRKKVFKSKKSEDGGGFAQIWCSEDKWAGGG